MQIDSKVNTGYFMPQTGSQALKSGADMEPAEEVKDYGKLLEEKRNELWTQIMNGDTEPTYQIGGQSFTEKEWERLLKRIDKEIETEKAKSRESEEEAQEEKTADREEIMDMMMRGAKSPKLLLQPRGLT